MQTPSLEIAILISKRRLGRFWRLSVNGASKKHIHGWRRTENLNIL